METGPDEEHLLLEHPSGASVALVVHPLRTADDYARCEDLQRATWGEDFDELASAAMMRLAQKVGGVAAGAFDIGGGLAGFVFGFTGLRAGRPAHWSHILAVRRGFGGLGLGIRLKVYQRRVLLALGVEVVFWTYDPLVARNAHINLNRLGARLEDYVRDFYGDGSRNVLHRGIGTDRFVIRWELADPAVDRRLEGNNPPPASWRDAPITNADADGIPHSGDFELPDVSRVKIEIPTDIQTVKSESPEIGAAWRASSRRAFEGYLERGFETVGFLRERFEERCFYILERR